MPRHESPRIEIAIIAFLAITFVLLIAAHTAGMPRATLRAARRTAAMSRPSMPMSQQMLVGGVWRTDGWFESTIHLQNVLAVAPLAISATLYMADGTPYALAPVTVAASGSATINVNQALASAPAALDGHLSDFGSVALVYIWDSPGHLDAEIVNKNIPESLITTSLVMPMPMPPVEQALKSSIREMERSASWHVVDASLKLAQNPGAPAQPPPTPSATPAMPWIQQALWWRHDSGVRTTLVLTNAAGSVTEGRWRLSDAEGGLLGWQNVELGPHASLVIPLHALIETMPPGLRQAGGLAVQELPTPATANSLSMPPSGNLLATGWEVNPRNGFSADLDITQIMPGKPVTDTVAAAGMMVGVPMPGAHFPGDVRFHPYGYLRNTTHHELRVALAVSLVPPMGSSQGAAAAPLASDAAVIELAPGETRRIGLARWAQRLQLRAGGAPAAGEMLNWSASCIGWPGQLLMSAGSVDDSGTYVFQILPQREGPSMGYGLPYWSTANGNDTMYSIWNPSAGEQKLVLMISPSSGSNTYMLPLDLEPGASTTVDLAMLSAEGIPDANGHLLPAGPASGGAMLEPAGTPPPNANGIIMLPKTGFPLLHVVTSAGVYNPLTATCGTSCNCCCGCSNGTVVATPGSVDVGETFSADLTVEDCNGYWDDESAFADWYGRDGAEPQGTGGEFLAGGVGQELAGGDAYVYIPASGTCLCGCPEGDVGGSTNVPASPVITAITPTIGLVGTQKTVTINGAGLTGGSNAGTPSITWSGTGGVSDTNLSAVSDSELQFTINSTPGTSQGNASLAVEVDGYASNSVSFFVQIPARASLAPSACTGSSGIGPLQVVSDSNVTNCDGIVLTKAPICGVYRNLNYNLLDQNGNAIDDDTSVTLTENFSGFQTDIAGDAAPASFSTPTPAIGFIDTQFIGDPAPTCLGSNDHDSFNQAFTVRVGTYTYPLTTVVSISRGYFSGTAELNVTITTP